MSSMQLVRNSLMVWFVLSFIECSLKDSIVFFVCRLSWVSWNCRSLILYDMLHFWVFDVDWLGFVVVLFVL